MDARIKMFQIMENHLHKRIVDKYPLDYIVWIEAVPFCSINYIKDGRYLLESEAPEFERVINARKKVGVLSDMLCSQLTVGVTES